MNITTLCRSLWVPLLPLAFTYTPASATEPAAPTGNFVYVSGSISAAIKSLSGPGTIYIPKGDYKESIVVPSGVNLVCAGDGGGRQAGSRIHAVSPGVSIITFSGRFSSIANCWIDGGGLSQTTAITLAHATHISARNVHVDSVETAVASSDSYFIEFDTVNVLGAKNGWMMNSASNSVVLLNCNIVGPPGPSIGLEWHNSAALSIIASTFEGVAPIRMWQVQGASISGSYFENDGAPFDSYITLGDSSSHAAHGVSITGNLFNHGASYAVTVRNADGLQVEGNHVVTLKAVLLHDDDQGGSNHPLMIASNSYPAVSGNSFKTAAYSNGTAPQNSDFAGELTLVSGTKSYTFSEPYSAPPICVVSSTAAKPAAAQVVTTPKQLTVTVPGGSNRDTYNYLCTPR